MYEETLAWLMDPDYRPTALYAATERDALIGWVAFPFAHDARTAIKRIVRPTVSTEIVKELLPREGQLPDPAGGYILNRGTFFLRADSQAELRAGMLSIIDSYVVEYEAA